MTQYQLTLDPETVQRLFGDDEQLRQVLDAVVNQVLEAQMSEHVQAEPYRQRLRTTNAVERLNEELRRRARVIRIFPTRESVLRLLGALLLEQDEAWTTGKRYFDMTAYWQWRREASM